MSSMFAACFPFLRKKLPSPGLKQTELVTRVYPQSGLKADTFTASTAHRQPQAVPLVKPVAPSFEEIVQKMEAAKVARQLPDVPTHRVTPGQIRQPEKSLDERLAALHRATGRPHLNPNSTIEEKIQHIQALQVFKQLPDVPKHKIVLSAQQRKILSVRSQCQAMAKEINADRTLSPARRQQKLRELATIQREFIQRAKAS